MLWQGQPDEQLIKNGIRKSTYVPAKQTSIHALMSESSIAPRATGGLSLVWLTLHPRQLLQTKRPTPVSCDSLSLRACHRALEGSFPGLRKNWLGPNVRFPTRLCRLVWLPL